MKRKITALALAIFIVLGFAGCSLPESYPIEDLMNILVAGLDVEGEDIVLTVYVDTIKGTKPGEEEVSYKLFTAKGKTVFEAKRALHAFVEKRVSWFHTKYLIVGEEAVKQDIDDIFSFFMEDDETRLLYRIAVSKGMKAQDFLKKAGGIKAPLADYLDTLFREAERTGMSREIHLLNYASYREIPWVSVYIPTVELITNPAGESEAGSEGGKEGGGSSEKKEEAYLVKVEGFAVFDEDRLAGYLDRYLARGLNFINNEVRGTVISVNDKDGSKAALELKQSETKIAPDFDTMSVEIYVDIKSNIVEFTDISPLNEQDMMYVAQQQNEYVCGEIAQTVSALQKMGCDPGFIMDEFYHKDPVKWQGMKDNWKEIFSKLNVKVKVTTRILNVYEITDAVGKGGD